MFERGRAIQMLGVAAIAFAWCGPAAAIEGASRSVTDCSGSAIEFAPAAPPRRPDATEARKIDLAEGFGIQYWGDAYTAHHLSQTPHGLLFIEPATASRDASPTGREVWFTPGEVSEIRRDGARPVLAYMNVGVIETYRDYWIDADNDERAALRGGTGPGGAPIAAFWTDAWRAVLFDRLDRLLDTGFDGVLLDDVLQYYDVSTALATVARDMPRTPQDPPTFARAMMNLILALRRHADTHRCGTLLVVNNGVFVGRDAGPDARGDFDAYRRAIDGIMIESLFTPRAQPPAISALREDFVALGIPVFDVEIASSLPGMAIDTFRSVAQRNAYSLGAHAYVAKTHEYNALEAPIISEPGVGAPRIPSVAAPPLRKNLAESRTAARPTPQFP